MSMNTRFRCALALPVLALGLLGTSVRAAGVPCDACDGLPRPFGPPAWSPAPVEPGLPPVGEPGTPPDMPPVPPVDTPGTPPDVGTPNLDAIGQPPFDQGATSSNVLADLQAGSGFRGASGNPSASPGYIDYAVPITQFRLQFDAAYGNRTPDRAEFFYPQCGCFGGNSPGPGNPPPNLSLNNDIDYQDIRPYLELAVTEDFSIFGDLPVRFIDPEVDPSTLPIPARGAVPTDNTSGLADMMVGFKSVLYRDCDQYFTFQLKAYLPTGDSDRGLGTDHVSLEPGILYFGKLNRDWSLMGELRYWIPVDGSNLANGDHFAGEVVRYGIGTGYNAYDSCCVTVTPIVEFVGWSVLDGLQTNLNNANAVEGASTTIVNAKFGVRTYFKGDLPSSFYVGYGRSLTGPVWYEDILRVEYAVYF